MGWDWMGREKTGWDKMGQDKRNPLCLPCYPQPYFLEGFQQAQTVTRVTRRKMPPVERMM